MPKLRDAIQQVEAFLANQISLEEFEDWSALFSWDIHRSGAPEAQALAYQIRAILNEYSDDLHDERIREELVGAIHPFAESPVYSAAKQVVYGKRPPASASTVNASLRLCAALR